MRYEYDSYRKNVLIRNQGNGYFPEIIHKGDKQWSVYSGSVVKTKIQAFYNEPIYVAELRRDIH